MTFKNIYYPLHPQRWRGYSVSTKGEPMKLRQNADLTHEDTVDWYGGYARHIATKHDDCFPVQAIEYEWLNSPDEEVVAKLKEGYNNLTDDDIEAILSTAREVRAGGDIIEEHLKEAVAAYQRCDLDGVIKALEEAKGMEAFCHRYGGDSNAADSLRSQLLVEDE
jgi:hypothetical protein